jgi:glycosyltransferase involved in cell wall biosynthesis
MSGNMKINFVMPVVGLSGGIRVVAIYAKKLQERGHIVHLISPPSPSPTWRRRIRNLINGDHHVRIPPSHFDGLDVAHHVLERHRQVVDSDVPDADLTIATWWETAEWVAALSRSKGAKAYFVQHHEVFSWLPRERVEATYRLPLHKIVIAEWLRRVMSEQYGDDDVDLVSNAVDHAQFFAPPRSKQQRATVGFMYNTADFKGVDVTLEVVRRVRRRKPDLRVLVFGGEAMPASVCPGAEYVRRPAQHLIRDIYAGCDVWLTASRSEGFNLPAMEAMACRTPVVSTRTGWPEEAIVNGVNGWCVEVDDVDAMTAATARVLESSNEVWQSMSQNAHATVEHASWDTAALQFEAALFRAVASHRQSARAKR